MKIFSGKATLHIACLAALLCAASSASAQTAKKIQSKDYGRYNKVWLRFSWSNGTCCDTDWIGTIACCYDVTNPVVPPMTICQVGYDGRPYLLVPYRAKRLNVSFTKGPRTIWTGWFDVE